jgi:hypothetical protein
MDYFVSEDPKDVTCGSCKRSHIYKETMTKITYKEERKQVKSLLVNLITEEGLEHMIFTVLDSMFASVIKQFAESPEYCMRGNYIGTFMEDKTPREKAEILAHEIAGDLLLQNGQLIMKDSTHAVNIMVSIVKGLSVSKLLIHAIDFRRENSTSRENLLKDNIEELEKDLAETEKENRRLINQNDELVSENRDNSRKLRSIEDTINDDK